MIMIQIKKGELLLRFYELVTNKLSPRITYSSVIFITQTYIKKPKGIRSKNTKYFMMIVNDGEIDVITE